MRVNLTTFEQLHQPVYVLEESKLRRNLELISRIAKDADVEIILAFKAFALWKTFPIFREYINTVTASSLNEARLGYEEFGHLVHTYSPAYTDYEIDAIAKMSTHLTFNSLSQMDKYAARIKKINPTVSLGIRVNPEYSEVKNVLYNPCALGTRFGVRADKLPEQLPNDIEGFHCHCHCENGADVFQRTLAHFEEKFAKWFTQLKWINFGGGHLMTHADYDVELLVKILRDFHKRHPSLHIILEPGSAFLWETGPLVSQVVDITEDKGIRNAILNVSFTCHMPDCLEGPYWPDVRNAQTIESRDGAFAMNAGLRHVYRLGGCSCLAGDFMGYWNFDHELQLGENVIFEDMIHYTTVKTNMFNGVSHPSIALAHPNGELELLRQYSYEDYKFRMD
ncbi:carboxynorspermidine decarboxylase [Hallella colorans]|uniref:carboxynorspermidine decarboxylase n=1 Tax=Hallella colorans TaxID=1703337 RepID=UPI0023F391AC|nr:carboxynorspermidine decarboxylase [Hallella colorans]